VLRDKYRDSIPGEGSERMVAGIATLTASCRFTPERSLRISWSRVTTNYNRDADVIMMEPGYRF
jgi:hypothetical protein